MRPDRFSYFSESVVDAFGRLEFRLRDYTEFDRDCPDRLRDAIRYSLLAPGKRLRPLLVLAAADACGGRADDSIPAACAVEMIHTYSLIHDDLPAMDDDDVRRGQPTCHTKFDEATAILAGDALIPLAFEVLVRDSRTAEIARLSTIELSSAAGATRLVGGQVDDLRGADGHCSLQNLESIHRRKTAALFVASVKLGAISAEAIPAVVLALENFGKCLGLAFQILDDLLDFSPNQSRMEKADQITANRSALTYPGLIGLESSRAESRRLLDLAVESLADFGSRGDGLRRFANSLKPAGS